MKIITDFKDTQALENNTIYVDAEKSFLNNSNVRFRGNNNILFVEDGATLQGANINFNGNNCVLYLSKSNRPYTIAIDLWESNAVYIGNNNYFNGIFHAIASESKNIIIGDDSIISFGIWLRTADPHLVYSTESYKRINYSKSVFIGDHTWLGQAALILKGCKIGSGSIIGGGSVASNKLVPSNTSFAGNPAKMVAKDIFIDPRSVHKWTDDDTKKNEKLKTDKWIYEKSKNTIDISVLDEKLQKAKTAEKK